MREERLINALDGLCARPYRSNTESQIDLASKSLRSLKAQPCIAGMNSNCSAEVARGRHRDDPDGDFVGLREGWGSTAWMGRYELGMTL
jgi:hypothetical protein